jgi:hypothetical protein
MLQHSIATIHDCHRQEMISHPSLCTKLTPFIHHKNRRVLFCAVVGLATFIFSTLFSSTGLPTDSSTWHRRKTQNTEEAQDQQALTKSWAQHHIKPLRATAKTGEEVSLFWHIPKSGGTTGESSRNMLTFLLARSVDLAFFSLRETRHMPPHDSQEVIRMHGESILAFNL